MNTQRISTILFVLSMGVAVLFGSCHRGPSAEEQRQMEESARKARQDSLAKVQADSMERVQREQEEAQRVAAEHEQQRLASLKFHVILGGFIYKNNATGFLARQVQQHPEAKIFIAPNGFKLVSIGDFATMQEAVSMIRRLHSQQADPQDMWVYQEGGPYTTSSYLFSREAEE